MYTLELYQDGDMHTPVMSRDVGHWRDDAREQFVSLRERFKRGASGNAYRLVLRDLDGEVELSYEPEPSIFDHD